MTESRLKKIVRFATASAVSFLFFVLVVIAMQYIKMGELKSLQSSLSDELSGLMSQRQQLTEQVSYMQTQEYVELYARQILGWSKDGETKFVTSGTSGN